jgi:hypothetical protein
MSNSFMSPVHNSLLDTLYAAALAPSQKFGVGLKVRVRKGEGSYGSFAPGDIVTITGTIPYGSSLRYEINGNRNGGYGFAESRFEEIPAQERTVYRVAAKNRLALVWGEEYVSELAAKKGIEDDGITGQEYEIYKETRTLATTVKVSTKTTTTRVLETV